MRYDSGEIDLEGVCFGEWNKNIQAMLEKTAVDTLKIMLYQNPPQLGYNLEGETARLEIYTEAFSVGDFIVFSEELFTAVKQEIEMHVLGGRDDDDGWLDAEGKQYVSKIRDDLQKNLDYVNMWLAREPK